MKDSEYDALYDGIVRERADSASKVIQFAEDLLTAMLEDGEAGAYEKDVDRAANLLHVLNQEFKNESLWIVSAADGGNHA